MPRHEITPEQEATEREKAHRGTRVRRLVYVLVVVAAWLAIGGVGGPTVGRLSEAQQNDNTAFLPRTAESTTVSQLAARFNPSTSLPYFVVVERAGGLTGADRAAVQGFVKGVPDLRFAVGGKALGPYLSQPPAAAIPSEDGKALLVPVELDADKADEVLGNSSVLFEGAAALRASAKETLAPSGLHVYVTGPGGTLADFVTAFGGIDGILLGVALGVVFLILLIVYRSPILPFAVLLTAVFGLAAAALVIFPLAKNGTIGLNGQSQGILSILVVGAATDYALLLVARYREELHDHPSKWAAMRVAWRAAVEPIGASAATVILGLLCLHAVPAGQHPRPRPGRRHRHRRRGRRRADLPARRPAALRPPHLLAPRPAGRPRPRRGRRGHPGDMGPRGRHGRTPPPPYLGGHAAGAAGARRVRPDVPRRGRHPVPALPRQGGVGHRPGGARPPLPGRLRQPGRGRRRREQGRPGRGHADPGQGRLRGHRHLQPARRARRAAEGRRRQGPGPGHPAPGRGQPGRRGRGHPPAQRAGSGRHGRAGRRQLGVQPGRQARQRARPARDHPRDPAGDPARADAAAALARGPGAAGAGQRRVLRRDPRRVGAGRSTTSSTTRAPTPRRRSMPSCSSSPWASTTPSS